MANRIQYRRDTAANWTAANPVLAAGETGYETDSGAIKIGDGTTPWNSLPRYAGVKTKRAAVSFGSANQTIGASAYDYCQRAMFILPMNVTRYRIKVRNKNGSNLTALTTPITITGMAIGTPAYKTDGRWNGNYASTPTTLVSTNQSVPTDGTDYVSPWFTAPAITADTPQLFSMGWTSTATGSGMTISSTQALAISIAGSSGNYAALTLAGNATIGSGTWAHDVRLEYEYNAGPNSLCGIFIGDSITEGIGDGDQTAAPQSGCLPHESWPGAFGLKNGHAVINAGIGGSLASGWSTGQLSRFDLSTIVPDYAVIGYGSNDANVSYTLANYQSSIQGIINSLAGMGINRVYVSTIIPRSFPTGSLTAAVAANATTFTTTINPGTGTVLVGAGTANAEYVNVTAVTGSASPYTVTGTCTKAHTSGDPVASTQETSRLQFNTWVRDLPKGVAGCFDMDKVLRNPTNNTICEGDAISSDNTHPIRGGYQRMAQAAVGVH